MRIVFWLWSFFFDVALVMQIQNFENIEINNLNNALLLPFFSYFDELVSEKFRVE